jgi:hypothetical protein
VAVAAAGLIAGNRPAALPAPISELETPFRSGRGPSVTSAPNGVVPVDDVAGEVGVAVTATVSFATSGIHFAVVTMLAVAVSCTELTEVALAATAIWACRLTALVSVTVPTVQVAVLSPLAQPLVNAGFWLDGVELRATDTPAAEPFCAETVTPNVASCPRWTLDCAGWTLTHSSAGAALELEPAPACAVVLALAPGFAVMYVLSEAETRADADGWDDDGDEDADPEGAPDPDGDPAADGDPEADGDSGSDGDSAADGETDGDPAADGETDGDPAADGETDGDPAADGDGAGVAELDEDGEADGEGEGEGEGDGDGDDDGDGDGDGVPAVRSTSQVVSVFEDELEIVPPKAGLSEPARAMVGQIASTPKISKPPASKLSVLARTCAKRIYIALSA